MYKQSNNTTYQIKIICMLNNWLWLWLRHALFNDKLCDHSTFKKIPDSSELKKSDLHF